MMVDDSQKRVFELVEWAPDQLIYDYDTPAFQAYLVVNGNVDIFSLKLLNSIGTNEIFGESSLLLDRNHRSKSYQWRFCATDFKRVLQ